MEFIESILSCLDEGAIVADREGKILYINQTALCLLGIDIKGKSPQSLFELQDWYKSDGLTPYTLQELPGSRALAGEAVAETEILIHNTSCASGIWVSARATPLSNEAGENQGAVLTFRDITKKKESDEQLLMLTNAVEQTADSIVIVNKNGLIEYVNPAFEQTTGYSREEMLGRNPRVLKSGIHDAAFYREMWATILSGKPFRATITNKKKSGEIYYAEQTITPMKDSTGNINRFVSVIKDVTEQRKLQEHEAQMSLARAVQQQFYTLPAPQAEGLDIAGAAFPAYETGGDYFDFVPLQGNRIGIAIGDVAGHGISSALLMVELRAYLRAFARKSSDAGEILSLVNNLLVSDLERYQYATLAFCCLNPVDRSIVYASAGHIPGYILGTEGEIIKTLESIDVPLGLFADRTFSCGEPVILEPGQILALLTDGIIEAERPDQSPFGINRALEFIHEHRQESAKQIVEGLYQAVRNFADGLSQMDDITAIICKAPAAS
jgi:PAS domain S-box-containing protein